VICREHDSGDNAENGANSTAGIDNGLHADYRCGFFWRIILPCALSFLTGVFLGMLIFYAMMVSFP